MHEEIEKICIIVGIWPGRRARDTLTMQYGIRPQTVDFERTLSNSLSSSIHNVSCTAMMVDDWPVWDHADCKDRKRISTLEKAIMLSKSR